MSVSYKYIKSQAIRWHRNSLFSKPLEEAYVQQWITFDCYDDIKSTPRKLEVRTAPRPIPLFTAELRLLLGLQYSYVKMKSTVP